MDTAKSHEYELVKNAESTLAVHLYLLIRIENKHVYTVKTKWLFNSSVVNRVTEHLVVSLQVGRHPNNKGGSKIFISTLVDGVSLFMIKAPSVC